MKPLTKIANDMRANTTAVRVSFNWLGTRKTLEPDQRRKAAETFGADKDYLSATQKLFDTRHPAFARLTKVKNEAIAYWKTCTLPYTEDGIRLLHKDKVEEFSQAMEAYRADFLEGVQKLDETLWELKEEARKRLGDLFNEAHYPDSVAPHFGMEWSFPSIEPPEYLAQLSPKVFEQEKLRVQQRLEEAIQLAEAAFLHEFNDLIATLHERLQPGPDGTRKIFKDSTVTNLQEFFTRFKQLNVGSNADLEKLVSQAQELVHGITPEELRNLQTLREEVAHGMKSISDKLTPLVVSAPRRKIIKPIKDPNHAQKAEKEGESMGAKKLATVPA